MEQIRSIELITKPEARRRTGLGERQFTQAVERGEISEYRIGGWPRFLWPEIVGWIESKRRSSESRTGKRGPVLRAEMSGYLEGRDGKPRVPR